MHPQSLPSTRTDAAATPCDFKIANGAYAAPVLRQRDKDKPHLTADQQRAARRSAELSRVYFRQYPHGLPANRLGVKYARYMCRTMAFLPDDRRELWLNKHALWMNADTRARILRLGPYWYSPRSLGQHLELDDDTRDAASAWSIAACNVTEEERAQFRRDKRTAAEALRRRQNGAKPRAEYEAQSLSRTKPWEAEGISRRTWYRRRGTSAWPPSPRTVTLSRPKPHPSVSVSDSVL
jgi:hypothetical protein